MRKWIVVCGLAAMPWFAVAADSGAVLGGAIGGAAGAAIGSEVGGRDGAIIGGAIGGATGAAIGSDSSGDGHVSRPRVYVEEDEGRPHEHHDNGKHKGWYKKGH